MGFVLVVKEVPGTPLWMAFIPPNILYGADESSTTLHVFEPDLQINILELKGEEQASSSVVHLQFNPNKTRLVGSAYRAGTIDVWDTENTENHNLNLLKTIRSPGKLGPSKAWQGAPHPNDLGTDSIITIDSQDDAYETEDNIYTGPSGCGSRHGVFYPQCADKATHYIIICEISH
ncbi:hypothetical protein MRS44_017723 [Fusarium solani]|uniref:uncharacterized protein n=1 Tax=Fusarium solani TaxID=169388 RepID=UPI0032C4785D|nr:hypothetical protein MRS44_017723 [Fusarium solani]